MTLTLKPILLNAGIHPDEAMVIRHAYVREHASVGLGHVCRYFLRHWEELTM